MAETTDIMKSLKSELNALLSNVDFSDVTSESAGFTQLPDGYYLCEVEKAELKTSKTTKKPMVSFQLKITENGFAVTINEDGSTEFEELKKTVNRKLFVHYVIKDEQSVKRFAADMLKFENENGDPILEKEYFMNADVLEDALDILVGMKIYVQVSTTTNDDDTTSTWNNFISWKRAAKLELPM